MPISKIDSPKPDDPHMLAVMVLIDAMRADFGERFVRTFQEDAHFEQFRRRLCKVLNGFGPREILAGYNYAVKGSPSFIPTIPEIEAACRTVRNVKLKAERETEEARKRKALPPPSQDADKREILKQMRTVLKKCEIR